jgi:hypothetical protein
MSGRQNGVQGHWKNAIKCENIFSRYSHIRWLIRLEIRYSQSKMAPDTRRPPLPCERAAESLPSPTLSSSIAPTSMGEVSVESRLLSVYLAPISLLILTPWFVAIPHHHPTRELGRIAGGKAFVWPYRDFEEQTLDIRLRNPFGLELSRLDIAVRATASR